MQETEDAVPENLAGKRDLYTTSEDGHFIGYDGFVVPRSFEEFFERHPRYVRGRVRQCWPNVGDTEREDRESELLIFLMTLPDKSKFRALGYNGFPKGCKDRIQTFNPDLAYLWSPKRNANGARNSFYEFMREVVPGDMIFSFFDTRIVAIGVAVSYCYECPSGAVPLID